MPATCEFIRNHTVKTYARNETILLQDETSDVVYCIKSGFVKAYDIDGQGCEQLLWFGSTGDLFPISWVFDLLPSVQYFFSAFTDVELYAIERSKLITYLEEHPDVLMSLTRMLAIRMHEAFAHLDATKKTRADEKVLYTLHWLALRFGNDIGEGKRQILLPLTHQDIANLLGLARETVTIELRKLKQQGYVSYTKTSFSIHSESIAERIGLRS